MENLIHISIERLQELESLESSIPSMIENAIAEYKKSNLKKLHERDKANPSAINLRVKRYVERHREEINRKRREKRLEQKKKEQEEVLGKNKIKLETLENPEQPTKIKSIYIRAAKKAIAKSDNPIVRKQLENEKIMPDNTIVNLPDRINNVMVRFDT
jgi:hypothetical protein